MKKILSLLLAGLMTASMFAVGASADTTETIVVGGPSKADGVLEDNFNANKSNSGEINVKVDKITHKYAVDMTFDFSDLTIGNIEWDVENMKYVKADGNTLANSDRTITISNRSDLPVNAEVAVSEDTANDFVTVDVETTYKDKTTKIEKATAATKSNAQGTATSLNVKINFTSENWDNVIAHYGQLFANNPETPSYKLAKITVTISKVSATEG